MKRLCVLGVLAAFVALAAFGLGQVPPPNNGNDQPVDKVTLDFETVNTPTACMVLDDDDNNQWVVQVVVDYVAVGNRTVSVGVFDENTSSWAAATVILGTDTDVAVVAGTGSVTFNYFVPKNTNWGQYIAANPQGCVYAEAAIRNGQAETDDDAGWLSVGP